jgi:hypothetical protein
MNITKSQFISRLPLTLFALICCFSLSAWVFARFVHYHAQYRVLRPDDYIVTVMPATIAKDAPATGDTYRKSDDGAYLVKVTILGTAPYADRATTDLLPLFVLGVIGVGASAYAQRQNVSHDA